MPDLALALRGTSGGRGIGAGQSGLPEHFRRHGRRLGHEQGHPSAAVPGTSPEQCPDLAEPVVAIGLPVRIVGAIPPDRGSG